MLKGNWQPVDSHKKNDSNFCNDLEQLKKCSSLRNSLRTISIFRCYLNFKIFHLEKMFKMFLQRNKGEKIALLFYWYLRFLTDFFNGFFLFFWIQMTKIDVWALKYKFNVKKDPFFVTYLLTLRDMHTVEVI